MSCTPNSENWFDNCTVEDVLMYALEHQMLNAVKACFTKLPIGAMDLSSLCQTRLVISTMPKVVLGVSEAALIVSGAQLVGISQILRGLKFIRSNCSAAGGSRDFCFCVIKLLKVILMHAVCTDGKHEIIEVQLDEHFGSNSAQDLLKPDKDVRLVSLVRREIQKFRNLVKTLLHDADAKINYIQGDMWNDFNAEFWKSLQEDLVAYLKVIKNFLPELKLEKVFEQDSSEWDSQVLTQLREKSTQGIQITENDVLTLLEDMCKQDTDATKENTKIHPYSEELTRVSQLSEYNTLHSNSAPNLPVAASKNTKNHLKHTSPFKRIKRKLNSTSDKENAAKKMKRLTVSEAVSLVLSDSESLFEFSQDAQRISNSSYGSIIPSPTHNSFAEGSPCKRLNISSHCSNRNRVVFSASNQSLQNITADSFVSFTSQSDNDDIPLAQWAEKHKERRGRKKRFPLSAVAPLLDSDSPLKFADNNLDTLPLSVLQCKNTKKLNSSPHTSNIADTCLNSSQSSEDIPLAQWARLTNSSPIKSDNGVKDDLPLSSWLLNSSPISCTKHFPLTSANYSPGDNLSLKQWLRNEASNNNKHSKEFYRHTPRRKLKYEASGEPRLLRSAKKKFTQQKTDQDRKKRLEKSFSEKVESDCSLNESDLQLTQLNDTSAEEIISESEGDDISLDLDWNPGLPDLKRFDYNAGDVSPLKPCFVMLERLNTSIHTSST
nr:uncharacterized protein LOC100183864 isoform X1 [Ciona intestinalis]|eukprot:XP_002120030.1 uncharacterized protein LOC100183864 isoform X1 [Ciona intestinalis]